MKAKITLILLLLLLFVTVGNVFAQVQISAPSSYQPSTLVQGGAQDTFKVDITNNSATALSGATFSLSFPAGMEYVSGTIAGATQLNITNLQNPTFTVNVPVGNTQPITFSARINCGYSSGTINYSVITGGSPVATGSSAVAGNTPAPAYVFSAAPSPQALSTPLNTNATRTIKFKNTGNVAVNTVYFESNVVTASYYPYYKLVSSNYGTVTPVTNGYRVTLTGVALQNAITTSVGTANASFDTDEEITIVLTEQITSCVLSNNIALNMKAGSGDTKNNFCFFDSSTASIFTPASNAAISITRLAGTTYPDFCTSGKVSYTIANTGNGASSSLFNMKLPWGTNYSNSGLTPTIEPEYIAIKKVFINGNDVTSLVLTRNGTGAGALIPGLQNGFVINLAGLTSAYGTSLQSLDGDSKYDDLLTGQSFQIDFEYEFNTAAFRNCTLNSANLPNTSSNYFSLGTSYSNQCGIRTNKTNYDSGIITDYTKPTFQLGGQLNNSFSASISKAALYPGDKVKLSTNLTASFSRAFVQPGKILKTFTLVLPDGLDYDSTGITKYGTTTVPITAISYNTSTKTLVVSPAASLSGINAPNDLLEIPLEVTGSGVVTNKAVQYSATFGFVGCAVTAPYGCNSVELNYSIINGSCPTVGTTSFDMTRNTFGYVPAPGNVNIWYKPTAYVNENTAGINLHGAVSKDEVKTTFKGIVNSTSFTELWARVKYTSNAATNSSNFDKLTPNATDVAGTITITKASDGSTISGNITVGEIVFTTDTPNNLQLQQVDLGTKIGAGKEINYTLQVGDQIIVNWLTKVSRDNLNYTYSQLLNLEGDLYTKDAVGASSDCQAIPAGFSIQRLRLVTNNNSGVQAIVGLNSLRVGASIINGNDSTDITGDHFPNEVRSYGVFRSIKATLPGIWVLDTAVGKEPYYNTTNMVANAAYKIDTSLFLVSYIGGNTIVTFNNSALDSNGMPLPTANLPVAADWTGVLGNTSLSFYMLPVCAASGNITTNIAQNFDIYTTKADGSNTESLPGTYNFGNSNTVYYNYTANAAPTLQNVDGISSTVKWQVRVVNTSDTAAITAAGGNASLPNNWMSFVSPNNNITVTKLVNISTGTEFPVVSYGTGKYWVKLGDIATTAIYNVEATYTTCVDDKLNFSYNFGASGYPIDPDQGYGTGLETCSATQSTADLNLYPKDVNISMLVSSPDNPVQFCTNTTPGENLINYSLNVSNAAIGNAEGLIMEAFFPEGYVARAGTSKLTHNGITKTINDPVYNSSKGIWEWNLSDDPNGIAFLPGAASGQNSMLLEYQGETQCGFISGSSVKYNIVSHSGCGKIVGYPASGNAMNLSMKPSSLNTYYLTPSVVNLKNDNSGGTYQIQVKNQGSLPLDPNELIYVTVPASIDYVTNSLVRTAGATNVTAPLSNTVNGNIRLLTFPLPVGADGVTLNQNEISGFNIDFKIIDASVLVCGTIKDAIHLESIYSVPGVTCSATACPVRIITGTADSDLGITKTALSITPGSSLAKFVSTINNDVIVKYTITNIGTIANSTPIIVDFFNDLNNDGVYIIGEPILYTQTISGSDANIAAGATNAEQTTVAFAMPESGMCNLKAVIRTINNVQICTESATLIPVNFESAQTTFSVCGNSDVTLGNVPNDAIVSWSPTTYLSDANISNPVFNYTGTPVTVKTDIVYTATITHPGGCSNTFTNTVTINPDPSVIITNPPAVCDGTVVDLTAASVTTGSDASLTYTYFTDAAGTISLVDANAVTEPDTYYIKATNPDGCFTIKPVVVTVNPLPTANITTTGPVCQNETLAPVVTFTGIGGTAPYTFTYKINNGSNLAVSTISGNSVNISAPTGTSGSFVYSLVDVKDSSSTTCLQAQTGTATVVINPLPSASISGTTAVCVGAVAQDITFTGAGGKAPYTFTYTVNGGTEETVITTSGDSVSVSVVADTAGIYEYSLVSVKDDSSIACVQAQTGTATVTVNSFPTASITGATVVCSGAASPNITFTGADGTAPYTFTYNINGEADQTVTTTNGNSVTVAASTGVTGDFDYNLIRVRDGNALSCEQSQTGTVTIKVESLPTATISGTTAVCKDDEAPNVTFTGSGGTTPYTFTYKLNGGTDQTVSTTGGSIAIIEAPTGTTGSFVYTLVSVKDVNGAACEQLQTGDATITVNPLPTAVIAGTIAVCKDAVAPDITFTGAGGTAPYTFTYNINGEANQTVATTSGNSVTVAAATNTTGSFVYNLVSVSDSSSSACEQLQTGDATITVNPLPTATISGTTAVCTGVVAQDVTFTGSGGTAPYAFTYNVNGGSDQTVTTTSGNSVTVSRATDTAGSFVYNLISVSDSSSSACTQLQTGNAIIIINPLPTATISGTIAVCKDAVAPDITFTGSGGTAPYTFTYNINGEVNQTVTTTSGNSVTLAAATNTTGSFVYNLVSVSDSSSLACEQLQTGDATITVNPLPTATISGTTSVCTGVVAQDITFTGSGGTAPYTFTYNVNGGSDQTVTTTIGNSVTVAAANDTAGSFVYNLISVSDSSSSACAQLQTGNATIIINPLPTATISGTIAVCKDAVAPDITFTGAGGTAPYTFTYNINGEVNQTVTTTSGNSVTVVAATNITGSFVYNLVSVSDSSSSACEQLQTGDATITVNPLPTAAISGTTAVCIGAVAQDVTFTGSGGTAPYTFTYNVNGGSDQTVTTTSANSVTVAAATNTAGSFVYNLISVSDSSLSACKQLQTGNATIIINPLPTAIISGTTSVCIGTPVQDVTFTGAGGTAPYTFTYNINGEANQTITTTSGNSVTVAAATNTTGSFVYNLVSVSDSSSTACEQLQTGSAVITVNPLLSQSGTESTTCSIDGSGYLLTFSVNGQAPYTVAGTGAPGTWNGNDWTSNIISAGTNYNVSVTDSNACNTIVITNIAPICCAYEVVCPTFPATTITCYNQLPTVVTLTKADFEALGNGDGRIGNIPCGVIEITASNSAEPACNGTVTRTYTVTEYADPNLNKVHDPGEDTVLNTTVCTQNFTLERADFVMPADQGTTVSCSSEAIAPVVPKVIDNCGNVLTASEPIISNIPSCNGVVTYTYSFTDCVGHTHNWIYTYMIDNTVAPQGTAPADVVVQCIADIPVANINAVVNVRSNCNNTVSVTVADINNGGSGCNSNPYIVTRTYTLTDCAGNETKLVQTLTAKDTTAPVFVGTLPGNITVECSAAIPVAALLTATDNCSVATVLYSEIRVNGSCAGNYQLQRTWIASDVCGNENKYTQIISVVDTTAPVFVETLPEAEVNADCDTIPVAVTLTATDTCGQAVVSYIETKIEGSCSAKYTLERTWTATDQCGNETSFMQKVNVACLANTFNAISPNGDGLNDTLKIEGLDCFTNNTVKVFNRYGVIVYEKKGYDNVTNPFAGYSDGRSTVKKGDKLPTGTYFYTLEYDDNGKQITKSGYLYVSNQ